jgi:D-alanyl-lipoteichoic acid acyltransferase DltB (MBOAT superfamily)
MLFNTFQFAYFFAILFPAYWALNRWYKAQNLLLLSAGYYFYACWEPRFLALLIISTVMDYACGLAVDRIEDNRKRKAFVALSMVLNLGMLGYFKYMNFFAASLKLALDKAGLHVPLWQIEVVLPIGISFYTFQSMSYVIDVYRREIKPTKNLLEFATFVSFFPHLVAGPIMRPTTLLPQIQAPRKFNIDQFYQGCYLIFWGLTKKVVVADNLALIVSELFGDKTGRWQTLDGGLALLAIYAFAWQIYCDFSGSPSAWGSSCP